MVGFNIFSSLTAQGNTTTVTTENNHNSSANNIGEANNPGSPRNLIIRPTGSDEPSALGSMSSSFLEVIPEGEEEGHSKESSFKKKANNNHTNSNSNHTTTCHSPRFSGAASMISRDTDNGMEERDYDQNPTKLYTMLQGREWEDAIDRIEKHPEEAKIWIYRKEIGGVGIRWRLLPIHASIIFKAPVEVVESVLTVYSHGARECDDQQSLPIHLAYKRGASASTFRVLFDAYPGCVDVKDAKGRTPRDLARNGSGPRHVEFVYALKVHMASRKLAREEARAEEEKKFAVKLQGAQRSHEEKLEEMRKKNSLEIQKMELKIKSLEHDVDASSPLSDCDSTRRPSLYNFKRDGI